MYCGLFCPIIRFDFRVENNEVKIGQSNHVKVMSRKGAQKNQVASTRMSTTDLGLPDCPWPMLYHLILRNYYI
jgi:hypothetical protein